MWLNAASSSSWLIGCCLHADTPFSLTMGYVEMPFRGRMMSCCDSLIWNVHVAFTADYSKLITMVFSMIHASAEPMPLAQWCQTLEVIDFLT